MDADHRYEQVGTTDEIARGEVRAFDVRGRAVAVANVDGTFHAFDDVCTHMECSLAEGELEDDRIVCPCHMGTFDVRTGQVLAGPPPAPVDVFAIRVQGGVIEVSLGDDVARTA